MTYRNVGRNKTSGSRRKDFGRSSDMFKVVDTEASSEALCID